MPCSLRIKMHEKRETKNKQEDVVPKGAVPAYLLDRYVCLSVCLSVRHMSFLLCCAAIPSQGGTVSCEGTEQHDQAEAEGEGGE